MFNKIIASILPYMPKNLVWIVSKNYIAGQQIEDAIQSTKYLNQEDTLATIDHLGEFITNIDDARVNRDGYLKLIDEVEASGVQTNYSLKPTMFGLLIDELLCYEYIRSIVAKAASYNNFIRIDMEDSPCVDKEINLYRKLKEEFPNNVGLVLQAYLKRSEEDIDKMLDFHTEENPLNFRLCKGIYVEPKEIAYKDRQEIRDNYMMLLEKMFKKGIYVGIATHDDYLIEKAFELIKKLEVPQEQYEFQMLYGVTPQLRKRVVDAGHQMRVYVPYGEDWFGYSTRRLKENPKMAGYITKAVLFGKS